MSASSAPDLPLGAAWDGRRTRLLVPAPGATAVWCCLAREDGREERIALAPLDDGTWYAELDEAPPGTRYGLRADGPFAPARGALWNPAKLLLDPAARLIDGPVPWHDALRVLAPGRDLRPDPRDTAALLPRAVVVETPAAWPAAARPRTPWHRTVIYEAHVRGLTMRHPDVPAPQRGTYLGLAHPAVIDHLRGLGVTAVELLPVTPCAPDARTARLGLTNYWGYNPYAWHAPDPRYAREPRRAIEEFRGMVAALHAAGIEVLVDVVLNHSGEGALHGPTLSLRGLADALFYRRRAGEDAYEDVTGCGNTIDVRRPLVRRLFREALRWWVERLGVDGFRFDLAAALGRGDEGFRPDAPFLEELRADPVLREAKLIAEPWDLGEGGYRLGEFPPPFAEWNDRYRDAVRRFWRGAGDASAFATALAGSSDRFGDAARGPHASVNYVTCHDGFTLRDLVTFTRKRNAANGEGNRDGRDENESHHWGVEGPTDDPVVLERRRRAAAALLATLCLSHGVPMLAHGDELGRTQQGNNNAYCHDGPLTWVDWTPAPGAEGLRSLVGRALALRGRCAALADGAHFPASGPAAVTWHAADGRPLAPRDWHDPALGVLVAAFASGASAHLLVVNRDLVARAIEPAAGPAGWRVLLDSAAPGGRPEATAPPLVAGALSVRLLARRGYSPIQGLWTT